MSRNHVLVSLILAASLGQASTAAESDKPSWDMLTAQPEVVQAWQDMRYGMFVCWGPVTLTGLEVGWSRGKSRPDQVQGGGGPTPAEVYDNLYKQWKPDKFDARQWVKTAQDGGMKYMIFLVKHHDGFCLYDTKLTEYKSTSPEAAWQHDVMQDIAAACQEAGLKLIIYYSQPDWHHPDYRTANHARYIEYLHGQIRELLTNYGRIDGLWFDLGGSPKDWDSERLFQMARSLQPWLVINNRCGLKGDFDTPEQTLGRFQLDRPWETCMTLGTQWSWKPNDNVKSLKQCIDVLVTCAVRNGNLALNTNPMPDGQIEPRQAERFREIGQWLQRYGASIYGTRGGPFQSAFWGGTTRREDTIYVHVLKWPGESVQLPPIPARKIVSHSVLTGGTAVVSQTEQGMEISVPSDQRCELDTIIALKLDGPATDLKTIRLPSASLAFGQKATASNVFQNSPEYAPERALDDDPTTRWGCDWGTHAAWLEVDLGQPRTFDRVYLSEPYGRVRKFELQVQRDGQWQTFHQGTMIGEEFSAKFAPVTGQHIRLNLLETTEGPSIWEFQLFACPPSNETTAPSR
jgi:alpha-L-fucosidase